jgi:hypothetical protein
MARLGPQVLAALGAAGVSPIAAQAIVAGAAAGLGTYLFTTFAQPVLDSIRDIFGFAPTKVEVTNSSGERVFGVRALAPQVSRKAITGAKSDVGREAMSISVFEVGQASSAGLKRPSFILAHAD